MPRPPDEPSPPTPIAGDAAPRREAPAPQGAAPTRVPVEMLVDVEALARAKGRPPTARELRALLPRGWVLEDDGRHARRDLRLLFRQGWILIVGLVVFGGVALTLFWNTCPGGLRGLLQLLFLLGLVLFAGGLVAPAITRALHRRDSPESASRRSRHG